jgi:hypothetical protein
LRWRDARLASDCWRSTRPLPPSFTRHIGIICLRSRPDPMSRSRPDPMNGWSGRSGSRASSWHWHSHHSCCGGGNSTSGGGGGGGGGGFPYGRPQSLDRQTGRVVDVPLTDRSAPPSKAARFPITTATTRRPKGRRRFGRTYASPSHRLSRARRRDFGQPCRRCYRPRSIQSPRRETRNRLRPRRPDGRAPATEIGLTIRPMRVNRPST